ncbi:hypothetical protein EJ110_NYTH24997 [Nymphaea thermarum]|nr:hypothetical protein EJ110_NYTH24997 [Nymphaea thermarum]
MSDFQTVLNMMHVSILTPDRSVERTVQVGLKRIDAAYDAMLPLGFSRSEVKSAIDSLKKVYGDKVVWPFIEEGSYGILIDTLLEQQKDKGKQVAASQGNELVVWEGATEQGESSSREQHDYDYSPRQQPCAAGDKRKSSDVSEGDDRSAGSSHQGSKGCGGWLSDED